LETVIEQGVREWTNSNNSTTVVVAVCSANVDNLCTSPFTVNFSRKAALWIQKRI